MGELIEFSEQKIKKKCKDQKFEEETLVKSSRKCLEEIKKFYGMWGLIIERDDQIAITKDFYRQLARKGRFDPFWINEKHQRMPQSGNIALSSLGKKYGNWNRKDLIINYWKENKYKSDKLISNFEPILRNYEIAISDKKTHRKPKLVEFRKLFLSIINLYNEVIIPLNNNSINFPKLVMLDLENNKKDTHLKNFCNEHIKRISFSSQIEDLKEEFGRQGANVFWGRVTLNPYTAEQKSQNYQKEENDPIKKLLEELKIIDLINDLLKQLRETNEENEKIVRNYFLKENSEEKIKALGKKHLSVIQRAQLFKPKPIPASIWGYLPEYLEENFNLKRSDVITLLSYIGAPIDISKEYKNNSSGFKLDNYPIKKAFDYAWHKLAEKEWNSKIDFDEKQCKDFLSHNFGIDIENNNFKLYASLNFMRQNLATLEHNSPSDPDMIKENIENSIKEIKNLGGKLPKKEKDSLEIISKWIGKTKQERKKDQEYQKAKADLGRFRGSLKNNEEKYEELTKKFKEIAQTYGGKFAELRDKFREQNEIKKISHFGIIIEDSSNRSKIDRYLLIREIEDDPKWKIHEEITSQEQRLKTCYVKSLTSKTLVKLIKNNGRYKKFHRYQACSEMPLIKNKGQYKKFHRNVLNTDFRGKYKKDPDFLKNLKKCLICSEMAKDQDWKKFGFEFHEKASYEQIEKEIDRKGYLLEEGYISKEKIERLVKEEKCLLFPFVNQDITSEERWDKNQFSKDWRLVFRKDSSFRLHPEFPIFYRKPTPNYPKENRYSRFQMIAGLVCEIVPKEPKCKYKKEQSRLFKEGLLEKEIEDFNKKYAPKDNYVVFGIDRGEKKTSHFMHTKQKKTNTRRF